MLKVRWLCATDDQKVWKMGTTLIAFDGHSFNRALRKKAATLAAKGKDLPTYYRKVRLRVDYKKLREALGATDDKLNSDDDSVALVYYTEQAEKKSDRMMGRVYKWLKSGGYGFIREVNGGNYFVHARSVERDGRNRDGYVTLEPGQIVSFEGRTDEGGREIASSVRVEMTAEGRDAYFSMRQDTFLTMLENTGYEIVRCRSAGDGRQHKSRFVDVRIVMDALNELTNEEDHLVLVSDDPVYKDLVETLKADGVKVTVAAFQSRRAEELMAAASDSVIFDDILKDIAYDAPTTETNNNSDDSEEDYDDESSYDGDEDEAALSRAKVHAASHHSK